MRHGLAFQSSLVALAIAWLTNSPALGATPQTPPTNLYDRIVWQYMQGKWDEFSPELTTQKKDIAALPAAQKADVELIRKAVAECRPAWWPVTKKGAKTRFKPTIWKTTLSATFDPSLKQNVQINFTNGEPSVVLSWDVKDMDNPAEAEHGFSKGELNDLSVWQTLGTAQSWLEIPLRAQVNLNDAQKLVNTRYLGFRGVVTSTYYATPRARRWAFWLAMWAYTPEHMKDPAVMSRRAMAAMFLAEVLSHRDLFPSIKFPPLPGDDIEANLTPNLKDWLGHDDFTFAEDNALRDAVKVFAEANEGKVRTTGKIMLPNGLPVMIDPEADKPAAKGRDAWITSHYPK